jgi:aminoglycoside 3-N-acetyltransferase
VADAPHTRASLATGLARLGVRPGDTLIVHVAMGQIGWICGGAVALIEALMDAVTPEGTLLMPAHSPDLSDPERWTNPPVPQTWWPSIREAMPAYDPAITPTFALGRTAELFRTWPGVSRSRHPHWSFAAWGAKRELLLRDQPLSFAMGEGSPLARLYELDGQVLLLGAGHESNTSFHLAEYRAQRAPVVRVSAPLVVEGQRRWSSFEELDFQSATFEAIGSALDATPLCHHGQLGGARTRRFSVRQAVDFATDWLRHSHVPPMENA